MFAQELPPDFDVPGRREPGERPELVADQTEVQGLPPQSPTRLTAGQIALLIVGTLIALAVLTLMIFAPSFRIGFGCTPDGVCL
jgi:hypothetical protein